MLRSLLFILFILTLALRSTRLPGQSLRPIASQSSISFQIKNLGIRTTGHFSEIEGKILFNPSNLSSSSFVIQIPTSSINTDNHLRDGHLKQDEYFNVNKYPLMKFTSSKVSHSGPGRYILEGKLTIKDVTKAISFPFEATAEAGGYTFFGEFPINRRDYHVGGRSLTLSNDLWVKIKVFAK
ncbi:YceI family protein [Dyadobacter tibetensis]|uniref:YceI family protein n=1 Tax=Dyadobacter tibetensis TaxID=1211851 RepID=UPI00046F5A0D|nr:YceI family protein [Dyadobacter tibetensis]